ncbi:MAG: DUF2586 domain-containing protein [Oscillospiraceae bacterium]|nr:DUF2586 domain-containing protein [Oscillospiraceae bacterium]
MALRDVNQTVTDGLLGNATAKGDGLHVKIGVSSVVSSTPIVVTGDMTAARIKERLGMSPLADAVMDAVQFGANRVYCIPVAATTAGSVGSVTKTGTGVGNVVATGSPTNRFSVIVRFTAKGELNSAAFTVSINGGYSFSDEITVPVTGMYSIAGTGIDLVFGEVGQGDLFAIDDTYTFQTTAPNMTNGEVLDAIAKLRNFSQEYEFVHVVGDSSLPLWQAVSEAQLELQDTYKKPVFFLLEADYPEDMDLTDWAMQMEDDRRKVKNYNLQVVAQWGQLVRLDGTTQLVNVAGIVSGLYAKAAVQESIGKTRTEAGFGISRSKLLELLPANRDDTVLETLDVAGYLTFREYDGLDDFYVYHTKMMGADGSDYRYAEDVRVLNKIMREVRKEALLLLSDDIDLDDVQGELETRAKFMAAPLQKMINSKEISSVQITVPEGQEETFLQEETMQVTVRYKSRGYIREISVDLGRSPATE